MLFNHVRWQLIARGVREPDGRDESGKGRVRFPKISRFPKESSFSKKSRFPKISGTRLLFLELLCSAV